MERNERLQGEQVIWLASVRRDGRPHLIPIWYVWLGEKFYICTGQRSVTARNLTARPFASIALQDGVEPIAAECQARQIETPYPSDLVDAFYRKYEWNIEQDHDYDAVFELTPQKWLF
jgi:F420H(2)-dependent biliverdin reductase